MRRQLPSTSVSNMNVFSVATSYYPEHGVDEFLTQALNPRSFESVSHRFGPQCEPLGRESVESVTMVLGQLRDFEFIENLLTRYYSVSQGSVIPSPLILSSLQSLSDSITTFNLFNDAADDNHQILQFSVDVLRSTSSRINITPSVSSSDFMHLFTGKSLRLEYLGIVFSVAARSCLIGLAKDGEQRDDFTRDMYRCSTICLRLARELTPVNDMLVWLDQEHLMLTACIEGDSSKWIGTPALHEF
jgi:hypothetical protein